MSDSDSIVSPGMVLAERYELTKEVGRGGFGMVWKARQLNMDRDVAIKVLPPKFMAIPDVVERFKREARLASRLRHPNTITVHDYGKHENLLFIVMELLEGEDLADLLMDEPTIPVERIIHIARQVLKSLDEAHSHGIVHRDLKPENIFLTQLGAETDFVKVLDFGIAKLAMPELQGKSKDQLRKLTMSGSTVGTPTYMSPEQAAGEQVDAQTDLYALGIILWEMAVGRPPFAHDNPVKVMRSHLFDKVPSFPDKTLEGTRFEAIVNRALEKDKDDRYESAREFLKEFDREVSELMEALVDEPPTVELEPGIGEINLEPEPGQDSEASIAYDRTDSYEATSVSDDTDKRQSTDGFFAESRKDADQKGDSIPFESVGESNRDRVREGASSTSSLSDTSALTDRSGLTERSGLNQSPTGFEQNTDTTTSSIITVVEPGPEDDVILLTDPKKSDGKHAPEEHVAEHQPDDVDHVEQPSVETSSASGEHEARVDEASPERPTEQSGARDASDSLVRESSDDAWEWGADSDEGSDGSVVYEKSRSGSVWLYAVLVLVALAAGAAYLYYAGILAW